MFYFECVVCVLSSIENLKVDFKTSSCHRRPLPPPPPRPPHPPPPPDRSPPLRRKSSKRWLSCPPPHRFWASRCIFFLSEGEPPPFHLATLGPSRLFRLPSSNVACRRSCFRSTHTSCPTELSGSNLVWSAHRFQCTGYRPARRFCFHMVSRPRRLARRCRCRGCR